MVKTVEVNNSKYRVQFISRYRNINDYNVMPVGILEKEERVSIADIGDMKGRPEYIEAVRIYEREEYADYILWCKKMGYDIEAPRSPLLNIK